MILSHSLKSLFRDTPIKVGALLKAAIVSAVIAAARPPLWADTVDFGVVGDTYDIVEQPLLEMIRERGRDINWTKAREDFMVELDAMYTYKMPRPICAEDKNTTVRDVYVVPNTVVSNGKVIFKEGDRISNPFPMGMTYSQCVIDGKSDLAAQVRAIKRANIKCDYFVANADSRAVSKALGWEVAPMFKLFEIRIDVKCLPTIAQFTGDKINYFELRPMSEIENEKGASDAR